MEKKGSALRHVLNLDIYIAGLALAVLVVLTVSGVGMRYIVNRPIYWMEEVQLWCFVWVVFLGACGVARLNAHIGIDAIVSFFPTRLRQAAGGLSLLVTIAAMSFLGYYSLMHVSQMYRRERLTNILGIPLALVYIVIPLACLIISLTSAWQLVTNRTIRKTDYDETKAAAADS